MALSVTQWMPSMGPQGEKVLWRRSSVILKGRLPMKMRVEGWTAGAEEEKSEEEAAAEEASFSVAEIDRNE